MNLRLTLLFCASLLPGGLAFAASGVTVNQPWSQALPPNAPTAAAYFVLNNEGDTADRLIAVYTPIAGSAQLHQHIHADGLMKMQQTESVDVPAHTQVPFAPMGRHVMLLDLQDRSRLIEGQHFPLTLTFEKAGDITVDVPVQRDPPAATSHSH